MAKKFVVLLEDPEYFVIIKNILIENVPVLFKTNELEKKEIKNIVEKLHKDYNIDIYFTDNVFGDLDFLKSDFKVKKIKCLNEESEIYKNFKRINDSEISINRDDIIFGKNKNIEFIKDYNLEEEHE